LGGLLPDILRILPSKYGDAPAYLRRPFFWVSLIILVILGGLAAYLLGPNGAVNAVAIGYAAPSILSKLVATQEKSDVETTRGPLRASSGSLTTNLRKWWAL